MREPTVIEMADQAEYAVPQALEEVLKILDATRRMGEFAGFAASVIAARSGSIQTRWLPSAQRVLGAHARPADPTLRRKLS